MYNKTSRTFLFGLIAGGLALLISAILRVMAGGVFVPELASQTLFSLTPGRVESLSVETFGSLAKYSAFVGAIIVNLIIYGGLAVLLQKIYSRIASKGFAFNLLSLSLVPYFVIVLITAVLLQLNQLLPKSSEIQYALIFLLLPHVAFGRTLYYMFKRSDRTETVKSATAVSEDSPTTSSAASRVQKISRRQFLTIAGSAVLVVIFYFWLRPLFNSQGPVNPTIPEPSVTPPLNVPAGSIFREPSLATFVSSEVTPNDRFYRIDTNIIVPSVDVNSWKLNVSGLVNNGPMQFTYQELTSMPSASEYATLECVSDKISGDLISTAHWKGVPLKTILQKAQVKPEAIYIVFRCYDGYDVGISLDRGLQDGTILAYEMNGVTLPTEHGFPLRVIVPGLYGMMNPKWITDIELVDTVYEGFWQRRGWANNAEYKTHSKIVSPGDTLAARFGRVAAPSMSSMVGNKSPIAGIAFAGDRGISLVEVSVDGGNSWQTASIKDPLSNNSWVLWALDWIPKNKGMYNIIVRATDKTGNVQTTEIAEPYPSGATGYHSVQTSAV